MLEIISKVTDLVCFYDTPEFLQRLLLELGKPQIKDLYSECLRFSNSSDIFAYCSSVDYNSGILTLLPEMYPYDNLEEKYTVFEICDYVEYYLMCVLVFQNIHQILEDNVGQIFKLITINGVDLNMHFNIGLCSWDKPLWIIVNRVSGASDSYLYEFRIDIYNPVKIAQNPGLLNRVALKAYRGWHWSYGGDVAIEECLPDLFFDIVERDLQNNPQLI